MRTQHSAGRRSHSVTGASRLLSAIALACATIAIPATGFAQQTSHQNSQQNAQLDARWQPWIGCWESAPQRAPVSFGAAAAERAPLVCVVPATDAATSSTVNVLTIANGKIVARDTIQATGQPVARSKDGCDGVENASWSADGHRLYVTSNFACANGIRRTSSGLFAMSPHDEWVNVQAVNTAGNERVRTVRYSSAGTPNTLPTDISAALAGNPRAARVARAAAGAPLTTASVVEASHKVDSTVVEAWIMDRGQSFGVDASKVVALADAGVPGNVTDAMVALSYPKAFALSAPADASGMPAIEPGENLPGSTLSGSSDGVARRNVEVMMLPSYSPFDYSPFGYSPYGYSPYAPYGYGYSPYGYGYSPYGYSPYGAAFGYSPYAAYGGVALGGWYAPPVIVLKGSQPALPRGYAVKGHGYTQSSPRSGSSGSSGTDASPRPTYYPPSASGQGTSAPPPPPPPPPSSGRTAHQRPGGQ